MSMHLRELKMNWPLHNPLFQLTAVVPSVDFVKALPAGAYASTQAGDM